MLTEEIIDVNTGELKSANNNGMLRSVAIGSCIVAACYDGRKKLGVMAHIMLPGKAPARAEAKSKYAKDAIDGIVSILKANGSSIESVDVCLVGAGNVLRKDNDSICKANIRSVTMILADMGFMVSACVLGGFERKSIRMHLDNGAVYFTRGDEKEQLLWGGNHPRC